MAKKIRYSVLVRVDLVTDINIMAETWVEALEKAKGLKMKDIVSLSGSYIDGRGVSLESISLY